MNYKYSDRITRILGYSKEEALRLNNDYIGPEHIMLGMIRDGESDALTSIKSKLCIDMDGIKHEIEDSLRKEESLKTSTDIALDQKSTTIMRLAVLEARLMRSEESDVEHVLLAMMKHNNNMVARIFRERHVTYKDMYDCFNSQKAPAHPKDDVEFDDEEDEDEDDEDDRRRGRRAVKKKKRWSPKNFLARHDDEDDEDDEDEDDDDDDDDDEEEAYLDDDDFEFEFLNMDGKDKLK